MNLREYLAAEGRGATERLAKRTGVSAQTISRAAKGLNEPAVSTAVKIAMGTGGLVPVDEVFCPAGEQREASR